MHSSTASSPNRWETEDGWAFVLYRINSGFVDFACAGAFLNLDQLGATVGKHLERTFTVSLLGARRIPRTSRAQLRLMR